MAPSGSGHHAEPARNLPAVVHDELADVLGEFTPIRRLGAGPRNVVHLVRSAHGESVVKLYPHLTVNQVRHIVDAEKLVAAAGVPVPALVHCSDRHAMTVHALVAGRHDRPRSTDEIEDCGRLFAAQLQALEGFSPSWAPPRPAQAPARARDAIAGTDTVAGSLIAATWAALSERASHRRTSASHVDWRADNLILGPGAVRAVLDWEALAVLPPAEAVGLAAASHTHSWRPETYEPFQLADAKLFVDAVLKVTPALAEKSEGTHLWLALLFAGCIRVVEDHSRGVAGSSVDELLTSVPNGCRSAEVTRVVAAHGRPT